MHIHDSWLADLLVVEEFRLYVYTENFTHYRNVLSKKTHHFFHSNALDKDTDMLFKHKEECTWLYYSFCEELFIDSVWLIWKCIQNQTKVAIYNFCQNKWVKKHLFSHYWMFSQTQRSEKEIFGKMLESFILSWLKNVHATVFPM